MPFGSQNLQESVCWRKKKGEQFCELGGRVNPTKDAERLGN